jgi:hypothetical protein
VPVMSPSTRGAEFIRSPLPDNLHVEDESAVLRTLCTTCCSGRPPAKAICDNPSFAEFEVETLFKSIVKQRVRLERFWRRRKNKHNTLNQRTALNYSFAIITAALSCLYTRQTKSTTPRTCKPSSTAQTRHVVQPKESAAPFQNGGQNKQKRIFFLFVLSQQKACKKGPLEPKEERLVLISPTLISLIFSSRYSLRGGVNMKDL